MDWILSHPDWESELPEENAEENEDNSAAAEETPVRVRKLLAAKPSILIVLYLVIF